MRLCVATLLCVVLLFNGQSIFGQQSKRISVQYDRFKNETAVESTPVLVFQDGKISETIELGFRTKFEGEKPIESPSLGWFSVIVASEKPPILGEGPIYFIADGQRYDTGRSYTSYPKTRREGMKFITRITISAALSFKEFKKVAQSDEIEVKIDNRIFKLPPTAIQNMRDVVAAASLTQSGQSK